MAIVICDSSFLILISKIGMLDLLIEAFKEIIIPQAVYVESVKQGKLFKKMDAFLIEERIKKRKIIVSDIENMTEKDRLIEDFGIHEGEAEAILLYLEKRANLLGTDDYKTIKVCKILDIKYFTTPTFLIRIFLNKKISKEIALLKVEQLLEFGWYQKAIIIDVKNKIKNSEE
jgi:predicted nucleic acid-binding protein